MLVWVGVGLGVFVGDTDTVEENDGVELVVGEYDTVELGDGVCDGVIDGEGVGLAGS